MSHRTRVGALATALLLAAAGSASAQWWGRPKPPSSGACFYEDINFNGRYFCAREGTSTTKVPSGTNDEISSIRIFGRATLQMTYRYSNIDGRSVSE